MPGISSSPRATRARARRIAAGLAFVALIAAASPHVAVASNDPQFKQLHHQLRKNKERIHHRLQRLHRLQREMNVLADKIFQTTQRVSMLQKQMDALHAQIVPLIKHLADLKRQLDERSREAYIQGPAVPILYLLTATSAGQAASRISLIDEMNRRDAILAQAVADTRDRLARARDTLFRTQSALGILLQQLAQYQKKLQGKMAESKRIYRQLKAKRERILLRISAVHPFAVCPVDGPHAVTNNFGVMVYRPKKWGGNHIHQGNDIMSPEGTPIVAPFGGTAVVATNHVGGIAVKVLGTFGFVYNAHLSRLGTLGQVKAGTVIGYVGHTGDTGANHDHFEWHPGNGSAVDPYDFLMKVC
jgi:murein DD-endopeptidase MepM/ murein hydrolase activator NlpD